MPLLEGRNLRKTYRLGKRNHVEALRGVDVTHRAGRDGRDHGPVRLGQEHAHAHPGPAPRARPRTTARGPSCRSTAATWSSLGEGERTRIRAREMGFVFQDFNLVPTLTALENVMLACDYAGVGGAPAAAGGARGPRPRRPRRPRRPPSGRAVRRRAAARRDRPGARQPAARSILADEPTGNLDSERSAEVLALLRRFNREHGQTFVLVTHDPEVGAACDRVVRMRDGRIRDSTAARPGAGAAVPAEVGPERPAEPGASSEAPVAQVWRTKAGGPSPRA